MIGDGPQSPSDDECARKVTVDGRERVGGRSGLEEDTGREIRDVSNAKH